MVKKALNIFTITMLLVYVPAIFVLTHMSLARSVMKTGFSDKSLHFLAYMAFIFILYSAFKPNEKVKWNKISVWLIILFALVYGALDEITQNLVANRSADPLDYLADVAGIFAGLAVMTFFSFWSSFSLIAATFLFVLPNCTNGGLLLCSKGVNDFYHIAGYSILTFTLLMRNFDKLLFGAGVWKYSREFFLASTVLVSSKIIGYKIGNWIRPMDYYVSFGAIIGVFIVFHIFLILCRRYTIPSLKIRK